MIGYRQLRGAVLAAIAGILFFASAAQAVTVTITTGDILRVDFDVSGMMPAYNPSAFAEFFFRERNITDVSWEATASGGAKSLTVAFASKAGDKFGAGVPGIWGPGPISLQFFDIVGTLAIAKAEFRQFDLATNQFAVSVGTFTLNGVPFIATPLPAALPLFLAGLAGFGFLARRRPRTASPPPRPD